MEESASTGAIKAVYRSIAYMEDNLGGELTIDDLAASASYSKFHYSRVFKEVVGTSPFRFLATMRMRRAQKLLRSSDLRVIDITCDIGYSSVGTFSTKFRKTFGISPGEYRRPTPKTLGGAHPPQQPPVFGSRNLLP